VISDDEAAGIGEDVRRGVSGAVLRAYVQALLEDREERVRELGDLRQRVERAFRYLDRLCGDSPPPPVVHVAVPRRVSRRRRPLTDRL
jgi:hypothetical protein